VAACAIASGPAFSLHNDIVVPYLLHYGNEEQKKKWIPKACSGELVTAIAMTEPGTGSDLQSVKTSAVMDGNHWVINGSKTFISNGQLADLVVVVCKTDPKLGAKGTSLIAVETTSEGFKRGRNLEKIGMKAQDTSELFFDNVRVPADNLLGGPGMGFAQLMQQLPQERRGHSLGPLDDRVEVDAVKQQVPLVEPQQRPSRVGVGQRQLGGQVDPARPGGERGLKQVGPVGGQQEGDVGGRVKPLHLVQQLEEQRVLTGPGSALLGDQVHDHR